MSLPFVVVAQIQLDCCIVVVAHHKRGHSFVGSKLVVVVVVVGRLVERKLVVVEHKLVVVERKLVVVERNLVGRHTRGRLVVQHMRVVVLQFVLEKKILAQYLNA